MTAGEVTKAIRDLLPQVAELERARAQCDEALCGALAAEPTRYDEARVREARRRKMQVEERITGLQDRIRALEAQLPTAEATRDAEREARALAKELAGANERLVGAWPRVTYALAQTERIAREVLFIRREAETATSKLRALGRDFGCDTSIIPAWRPSPADDKVTYLVGIFLEQLADGFGAAGVPSDVMLSLDAARVENGSSAVAY